MKFEFNEIFVGIVDSGNAIPSLPATFNPKFSAFLRKLPTIPASCGLFGFAPSFIISTSLVDFFCNLNISVPYTNGADNVFNILNPLVSSSITLSPLVFDIFLLIAVAALKDGSNNTVVFALIGKSLLLRISYFFSAVLPSFNTLVLNSSSIVLPIVIFYRMNLNWIYQLLLIF